MAAYIEKLEFSIVRKNVKNTSIRIYPDKKVVITANPNVSEKRIEMLIKQKESWIRNCFLKFEDMIFLNKDMLKSHSRHDTILVFESTLERFYPFFKVRGVDYPKLYLRRMKRRWGSCSKAKKEITLNEYLVVLPQNIIDYVVMHELCHLIQPNHSKAFYDLLTDLMPDWKDRRKILHKYMIE